MPVDFSFLTTFAECDAATAEIDFELKTFTVRDVVIDLADDRADRAKSSTTSRLAKVNGKIASADAVLASAGIDDDTREEATDERAALLVQRTALTKRNRLSTGTARFMVDVDAEQVDTQVATLTGIKAGIAAHRPTLSA